MDANGWNGFGRVVTNGQASGNLEAVIFDMDVIGSMQARVTSHLAFCSNLGGVTDCSSSAAFAAGLGDAGVYVVNASAVTGGNSSVMYGGSSNVLGACQGG